MLGHLTLALIPLPLIPPHPRLLEDASSMWKRDVVTS